MSQRYFYKSLEAVADDCRRLWQRCGAPPDVVLTFSSGGLFVTGCFQKAGMPKVPVYALPWQRVETEKGFHVVGVSLSQLVPPSLFQAGQIAIVDDIFDTGSTLSRLLNELAGQTAPYTKITCYAPYAKATFTRTPTTQCCCYWHAVIPDDVWAVFGWETAANEEIP